ncbi:hypothetical protein HPA02_21550 [Bisbaumannia pacifica]|uniref:Uncharacterized protein n=1 Tax=Bisbaumannia pacifica TaxID=77098 RepID=A0A510X8W1_9GAMM|nr:hypothetical protein HPA02_21550 [Halomonas pacifica]
MEAHPLMPRDLLARLEVIPVVAMQEFDELEEVVAPGPVEQGPERYIRGCWPGRKVHA